jgi:transcription antitermination protein NusB
VPRADERRSAVVALYQHDATGRPLTETLGAGASPFTVALASAAAERAGELDAMIARHARGWTVTRIHPLERSIMRVALLEIAHPGLVPGDTPIPAEGAIEEAVVQARTFCGAEAPAFVNGVLAAALRELRAGGGLRENGSVLEQASGR